MLVLSVVVAWYLFQLRVFGMTSHERFGVLRNPGPWPSNLGVSNTSCPCILRQAEGGGGFGPNGALAHARVYVGLTRGVKSVARVLQDSVANPSETRGAAS